MPPQEIISVIYVVGNLQTGGPTLQLLYLISNLDRTRFKPIVIVTSASGEPTQIERRLDQAGVEVIRIEAGKLASMFRAPLCLKRVVRGEARVVLHPYGFRSDIICWLSRVRPRLGNVRNNLRYNYQRSLGKRRGRIISAINQFFLSKTDLVVSCGEGVRKNLATLGQDSVTVRNAIDPEIYRDFMCSDSALQPKKYAEPTYLTVASKIPGKNIEFLVEEFALAPPGSRRLIVIGAANPDLIEKHANTPTVKFRGHVTKPGDAFLETDFFISASEHEGIPNAVLEALILGRPVVLSQIPAHLEIMQTSGEEVGSTFTWTGESLNQALETVENQDYQGLSDRSYVSAERHLHAREMAHRYQLVYEALVLQAPHTIEAQLEGLTAASPSGGAKLGKVRDHL